MALPSILCRFPLEILENVAFEVASLGPDHTYTSLTPLLCSCKYINALLSFFASNHLYARLLKDRFDLRAPDRRLGAHVTENEHLAAQFRVYSLNLQRLRRADISSPDILEILWTTFLMLLDNEGKNRWQLDRVGIDDFVDRFVLERLWANRWNNSGWPIDSPANSLVLWIMWMISTPEKLRTEPIQKRQLIISFILPYVLSAFRYPAAYAPPNYYHFPLSDDFEQPFPNSVLTAHGGYPLYREPIHSTQQLTHFGEVINMSVPLVTLAAKMLYFSRREIVPFNIPSHLPVNREQANQLGHFDVGPTQDDVIEFNAYVNTKLPPPSKWSWWEDLTEEELSLVFSGISTTNLKSLSAKWDNDWMRLTYCYNPWIDQPNKGTVYTSGLLTGLWQGRMIIPNELTYLHVAATAEYPAMFSENHPRVSTVPIYMRLREHHCISPQVPVAIGGQSDGFDDGLQNAFFPNVVSIDKNYHDHVVLEADGERTVYETFDPNRSNSHDEDTCLICLNSSSQQIEYDDDFSSIGLGVGDIESTCSGITDIIFTGETDLRHGQAWNHFSYIGRVRSWDGLIAILRIPHDPRLGRVIFYGYIINGQNFVGNWRPAGADVRSPCWESAFTMSRRDA